MSELTALIARLRDATGPDRELDIAIHNTLFPPDPSRVTDVKLPPGFGRDAISLEMHDARRYTASIDAALMLVPKGAAWIVLADCELSGRAYVNCLDLPPHNFNADAATPAIALCIAALEARKALTP